MARAAEFFAMDSEELEHRLGETRRELLNLRFQLATGQLDNVAQVKRARRDIARALTILRAIEIAEAEGHELEPPAPKPEQIRARRRAAAAAEEEGSGEPEAEAPQSRRARRSTGKDPAAEVTGDELDVAEPEVDDELDVAEPEVDDELDVAEPEVESGLEAKEPEAAEPETIDDEAGESEPAPTRGRMRRRAKDDEEPAPSRGRLRRSRRVDEEQ
jgi:large subunit ribosomal protein L29